MNLIREIRLPNGRVTWNLGLGCAGILRLPLARQRERLLRTAFDAGITHFDTARMYGLGAAEGIIGSTFHKHREALTLGTKFGLSMGVPNPLEVTVGAVGRWMVNLHPGLKKRLKRTSANRGDRSYDYSVKEMKRSLKMSLDELRTDRVDLFFLHEPRVHDTVPEDLEEALEAEVRSGRVGAFGVSGDSEDVVYLLKQRPVLCRQAVQYRRTWTIQPVLHEPVFRGVFHVLEGPLQQAAILLTKDAAFTKRWSERLECALSERENLGVVLLAIALNDDPKSMVLFFTSQASRLKRIVARLTRNAFSSEALTGFRQAISTQDLNAA
jgi:D-threo-aldose 1-dehydrogenase